MAAEQTSRRGSAQETANPTANPTVTPQELMAMFATMMQNNNQTASVVNVDRSIQWKDLPVFPGRNDRVDAWFLAFETLLKGSRVPRERYGEKFMECPKVGSELRTRLGRTKEGEPETNLTYDALRQKCLKMYGPPCPVGFHQAAIHSVRGATREDVMEALEDALALHNRAARDEERPEWEERDLLYPLINAFPADIGAKLRQELPMILRSSENLLLDLAARAPSKEEREALPRVAAVQSDVPEQMDVVAAIRELQQSLARDPRKRRNDCSGCGGSCETREKCPAFGKECRLCKGRNHFARTCRSRKRNDTPSRSVGGNPSFQAGSFGPAQAARRQ